MTIQKHSRQRDAILNELRSRFDHPTAEELYFSLKKELPNLSLGTVYRNLSTMAEDGIIMKIEGDGADRFDGNSANHYHFRCEKCGKVTDIYMPLFEDIENQAQNFADGTITSHRIVFSGVCKGCQQNK